MTSYSQAGQDTFVFEMLEHKTDGFFVDLGCSDAQKHSNTFGLEQIGWKGLLCDIVDGCEGRKGTFIKSDASNPNDRLRLYYKHLNPVVDYVSIDTDDALMGTFHAFPWSKVTARVITLETDVYRIGPRVRDELRIMLSGMGYTLVCGDVVVEWPEGTFVPYEDWWCSSDHVNPDLIKRFRCDNLYWRAILKL